MMLYGVSNLTGKPLAATTGKPVVAPLEHQNAGTAGAFSADGTRVVAASADKTAGCGTRQRESGGRAARTLEHQNAVTAAALSADGTRVVTASADKTARVWDATTRKPVVAPLEHQNAVTAAAFSADGTRVVTVSTGIARPIARRKMSGWQAFLILA